MRKPLVLMSGVFIISLLLIMVSKPADAEGKQPATVSRPHAVFNCSVDSAKPKMFEQTVDKEGNKVQVWCDGIPARAMQFRMVYIAINSSQALYIGKCPFREGLNNWSVLSNENNNTISNVFFTSYAMTNAKVLMDTGNGTRLVEIPAIYWHFDAESGKLTKTLVHERIWNDDSGRFDRWDKTVLNNVVMGGAPRSPDDL